MTKEDVVEAVRAWCHAWHTRDVRTMLAKVLTRDTQGWQVVLYHRDIQPFADDGRYPRALTMVSPAT